MGKRVIFGVGKLLEIDVGCGCTLMLYPSELRQGLAVEYWERGLKRGKAIRRRRLQTERERKLTEKGVSYG